MDQIRIGKFIAQLRKEQGITQRQLADKLGISDKTVSKWECGNGLPEVALMLPLCSILNITVNELLSGERISETDYRLKAEKNMMNLIEENRENKRNLLLSVLCVIITLIAVCALVIIASFIEMPAAARVAVLIFAGITAAAGVGAACFLDVKTGYYKCPYCHALFVPDIKDYVKGYHTFTKRRLKCPECGKIGMCSHHIVR